MVKHRLAAVVYTVGDVRVVVSATFYTIPITSLHRRIP